jgi:hypothetical protein
LCAPRRAARRAAAAARRGGTFSAMMMALLLLVLLSSAQLCGADTASPRGLVGGSELGLALLESSGAANGTFVASGRFCGEPSLVLVGGPTDPLTVLHGPTPFVVGRMSTGVTWDSSRVVAAAAPSNDTLAVLHESGQLQWVAVIGCRSLELVASHHVGRGASSLAVAGDGAVLVLTNHSSLLYTTIDGKLRPTDLGGHATCDGRWVAASSWGERLVLVCQRHSVGGVLQVTLLERSVHSRSWVSSPQPNITLGGTRHYTPPTQAPLLSVELLDVYGDGGATAALISTDSATTMIDVWSGDPALPTVGVTYKTLDPQRQWLATTSSPFLMTSYYPTRAQPAPSAGPDSQLIALRVPDATRSGSNEFVVNLLVFGQPSHLQRRQSSLRDWKGQRQFSLMEHTMALPIDGAQVKQWMTATNVDSFSFSVCDRSGDNSSTAYVQFVRFLELTKAFSVNGRQLRVALVLDPPTEATEGTGCHVPGDSPLTEFNDTALFDGTNYYNKTGYAAWGEIVGRLAEIYPHLVSLDIDDMSHDINPPWLTFTPDTVANITANMRRHAPWLTLAPTIYYAQTIPSFERWPDLPLALDMPIFFFRNQRQGAGPCAPPRCSNWWGPRANRLPNGTVDCPTCGCLAWTCAEPTVYNCPGEAAVMASALPEGRDMLIGFYATGHSSLGEPSPRYVQQLLQIAWGLPRVVGTSIWTMHVPGSNGSTAHPIVHPNMECAPGPDRLFGGDKGCIIQDFYASVGANNMNTSNTASSR